MKSDDVDGGGTVSVSVGHGLEDVLYLGPVSDNRAEVQVCGARLLCS